MNSNLDMQERCDSYHEVSLVLHFQILLAEMHKLDCIAHYPGYGKWQAFPQAELLTFTSSPNIGDGCSSIVSSKVNLLNGIYRLECATIIVSSFDKSKVCIRYRNP